jgi:hypothetical protein
LDRRSGVAGFKWGTPACQATFAAHADNFVSGVPHASKGNLFTSHGSDGRLVAQSRS